MTKNLVRQVYSHQAMVDAMIANPCVTAEELSITFGMSPGWIARVRSSDMFRELLAKRSAEIVDPMLVANVEERFNAVTTRSLEILLEKLSQPATEVSDELALAAATLGAKARGVGGFGAKVAPAPAPVDPERLERLASNLRSLNRPQPVEIVDVECKVSQAREAGTGGMPANS